ncbi:hypothetical protein FACS1894189_7920 [Planctomycetales bacterium]|nr:hypothetical protein FACS1894189_7920 [Planctomycetales bacterium]
MILTGENCAQEESMNFYLLRTGYLLEGTASSNGKTYLLKSNFGTMQVPVNNVEYVGKTKQDIYQYKRSCVDPANCNALIKLAEWCLGNGLREEGIAEYQRAGQAVNNAANNAAGNAVNNAVLADVIRQRLMSLQGGEEQEDRNKEIRNKNKEISQEAVKVQIPKPVLESFTRKVQPILAAHCAAADCHGSNSPQQFKIEIPREALGSTTYRNFQSVIKWIDLDYPTESALLSKLISYHGTAKASFSVESNQYNNVVQWIQLTAKELPLEDRDRLVVKREPVSPQANESKTAAQVPLQTDFLPKSFRNALLGKPPKSERYSERYSAIVPSPPVTPPKKTALPADPLDPDFFNTRYHGVADRGTENRK